MGTLSKSSFSFSQNISWFALKIIYFHYLENQVLDQGIQKNSLLRFENRSTCCRPFDAKLICKALNLLEHIAQWLLTWRQRLITEGLLPESSTTDMHNKKWYANLASFWHHLLEAICQACADWNPEVCITSFCTKSPEKSRIPPSIGATILEMDKPRRGIAPYRVYVCTPLTEIPYDNESQVFSRV